jgi:hypothetical protein
LLYVPNEIKDKNCSKIGVVKKTNTNKQKKQVIISKRSENEITGSEPSRCSSDEKTPSRQKITRYLQHRIKNARVTVPYLREVIFERAGKGNLKYVSISTSSYNLDQRVKEKLKIT